MGQSDMSGPLYVGGMLVAPSGAGVIPSKGKVWFVDVNAAGDRSGGSWTNAFITISAAVAAASAYDQILVAVGSYVETVTIPVTLTNLRIIGIGSFGGVIIAPSTTNANALVNLADSLTLINITCDADGTGAGFTNYGSFLRAYNCIFTGSTNGAIMTNGTAAQVLAGTHGTGSSCRLEDCVFRLNTNGIKIVATDQGAITNLRVLRALFHDNSAADMEEAVGSGGAASALWTGLELVDNVHCRLAAGTEPTKYLALDDDNGNKGVAMGNKFPTALNGGKNLVSTGLIWSGNFHTAGLSTTQPS